MRRNRRPFRKNVETTSTAAAQASGAVLASVSGEFAGGDVLIDFLMNFGNVAVGNWHYVGVYLDGVRHDTTNIGRYLTTSAANDQSAKTHMIPRLEGKHTIDVRIVAESTTFDVGSRTLRVAELPL